MTHDWAHLAELLRQECLETPFCLVPYHRGFYDLALDVARVLRDAEEGHAEEGLWLLLASALRGERAGACAEVELGSF